MTSKHQGKTPTQGEIKFVKEVLLKGADPLWMYWVTKRKREKIQDRLIVVGPYRIFSIKRTVTGKKQIQRVGHLYDLTELYSPDVDKLIIRFKDFEIDTSCPTAGTELLTVIRTALQRITCSFSEEVLPKITVLPSERVLPELPQIDYGPGHGFEETYLAYCDYFKQQPSPEFLGFFKDCVDKGSTELLMHECPGLERKENPVNFIPIRAALRHNTYFTSFSLIGVPRRDISAQLGDLFTYNRTIEKVTLNKCDAQEKAFVDLGAGLKRNPNNNLRELNFSNNPMKDKGAQGLAEGLRSLNHSLHVLNLAYCGLGSKGTSAIIQALSLGKDVSSNLQELDLSYNTIGPSGSVSLSNLFGQLGAIGSLKYLLLTNTKLDTALVIKSLKNGNCMSLEEIDISGNKIDALAAQSLATLIDSLSNLQNLNLSNCSLQGGQVNTILGSVIDNQNIQEAKINISNNDFGPVGATSIAKIIGSSRNIFSLIMRSCGFKKEGLTKIAESLKQNTSLRVLDVSLNFHTGNSSKMLKVVKTFAESITNHDKIEYFGVAGDGNKFVIGKEITPLFDMLSENPTLQELDITGNKIGDQLASQLCNSLRNNTNLKALYWDKNDIGMGGLQSLLNLLSSNKTLCHWRFPRTDMEKIIKSAKKDQFAQTKERLKEVKDNIQQAFKGNAKGETFVSAIKSQQARTYDEAYQENVDYGTLRHFNPDTATTESEIFSAPPPPPPEFDSEYSSNTMTAPPPPPLAVPSNDFAPPPPIPEFDETAGGYENEYQGEWDDTMYDENYEESYQEGYEESYQESYEENYQENNQEYQESASAPPPPPPPPPF